MRKKIMSMTQPIRNVNELEKIKNYYRYQNPNSRNYLLIILGLNTALRISDLLQLKYRDVYDSEKRKLKEHLDVTEKKTGKNTRIYLNQEVRTAFGQNFRPDETNMEKWLFPSQIQHEKPLSRQQAFRIIKKAAQAAGICENISCHSLRKTFGYFAWKQGVLPTMLMEIYNHSSYKITKRYLGIEQDDKDEIYRKIRL